MICFLQRFCLCCQDLATHAALDSQPLPCWNGGLGKGSHSVQMTVNEEQCQGLCVQPPALQQSPLVLTASWPEVKEGAPCLHRVDSGEPLLGSCKCGF